MNLPIRSPLRAPARAVARFRRSEDGSLTIFGLVIFVMMMVAGGIALDVMRSEMERTEMQYAIDRAVLAAANLEQGRDPEAVVKGYLRAAGIDEDSVEVTPEFTPFERSVAVSATTRTRSLFLDMLGVEELVQPISTEAREVRTELELSLVLDISGSMKDDKIRTLRTAASTFVRALLEGRETLTTISLVPYNDRVNAGTLAAGVFDFTEEHPFSNCIVFADDEFKRLDQAPGTRMQRTGHLDFRSSYNETNPNPPGLVKNPLCRTDNYAAILPWSNNVTELQSRIAQLEALGATAMDLGVKWGTLLLDPSSRDELAELTISPEVSAGERVNPIFAGRPVDYPTEGTRKVLVVMTDGENTEQWDTRHRTGNSGVWVRRECVVLLCVTPSGSGGVLSANLLGSNLTVNLFGADGSRCGRVDASGRIIGAASGNSPVGVGSVSQFQRNRNLLAVGLCRARFDDTENGRYNLRYSIWVPSQNKYWVPHLKIFQSTVYGGSDAVHLTWPQLLGSISTSFLANTVIPADSNNYNWDTRVDYFYAWQQTHGQTRADSNLSRLCAAAREKGIVIYKIAFQAPTAGRNAMRDCAGQGNEARYFDVEGLDIEQAFNDVLASVSRLRLTQ